MVGKTKGLITGVSKGLVGMVTKPLGGAAELVANTGEGMGSLSRFAFRTQISRTAFLTGVIKMLRF